MIKQLRRPSHCHFCIVFSSSPLFMSYEVILPSPSIYVTLTLIKNTPKHAFRLMLGARSLEFLTCIHINFVPFD